jgi:hypothetical protein
VHKKKVKYGNIGLYFFTGIDQNMDMASQTPCELYWIEKKGKIRIVNSILPMNKCFRSYPVLSLRKVPSMSRTVPFARTTSKPEIEF